MYNHVFIYVGFLFGAYSRCFVCPTVWPANKFNTTYGI